nr:prepilin-type N-terminal cleavage/methylation domain-containing protein [Elusimicrobiaceae bacterium]
MENSCKKKNGFTLIELLVVVIIIGVLSAIAIPGYMRSVEKSKAAGAMQALSDIAKAEHDYYAAQSKYTNDFSDLVLTMHDENTMDDADNSSYGTKHFVYNLQSNLDAATASRVGGDAPYTLYRLFDDPRIYCQPAGNKYCEMLDLPAGTFTTSIGSWQSCPGGTYPCTMNCARNTTSGYSCQGTYNEDGTFTEKVCDSNNFCVTTRYNEDQKALRKNVCSSYDDNGNCIAGGEGMYDEYGNLISAHTCTAWAEDGTCTAGDGGSVNMYDANGNMTASYYCTSWNTDGTCATKSGGSVYTHDANGNITGEVYCSSWKEDGSCNTYGEGIVAIYDTNGNRIAVIRCLQWSSEGTCTTFDTTNNRWSGTFGQIGQV